MDKTCAHVKNPIPFRQPLSAARPEKDMNNRFTSQDSNAGACIIHDLDWSTFVQNQFGHGLDKSMLVNFYWTDLLFSNCFHEIGTVEHFLARHVTREFGDIISGWIKNNVGWRINLFD